MRLFSLYSLHDSAFMIITEYHNFSFDKNTSKLTKLDILRNEVHHISKSK